MLKRSLIKHTIVMLIFTVISSIFVYADNTVVVTLLKI